MTTRRASKSRASISKKEAAALIDELLYAHRDLHLWYMEQHVDSGKTARLERALQIRYDKCIKAICK